MLFTSLHQETCGLCGVQTQECPSLLITAAFVARNAASLQQDPLSRRTLLTAAFLSHYIYRVVIFPWRMRSGKGTPLSVWALAFLFCIVNGTLQVRALKL